MKIVDIREIVVPIKSNIRNAYIDFSQMTVSALAVITDVVRDGHRVAGYGFNSNGRYAPSGLLRDRFIPRLKAADPQSLLAGAGDNLDPFKIWTVLMRNEKPGGHGERSVAIGVIDMAIWDAVAKIAGVPLYRLLADRFRGGVADPKVFCLRGRRLLLPGKRPPPLCRKKCSDIWTWVIPWSKLKSASSARGRFEPHRSRPEDFEARRPAGGGCERAF